MSLRHKIWRLVPFPSYASAQMLIWKSDTDKTAPGGKGASRWLGLGEKRAINHASPRKLEKKDTNRETEQNVGKSQESTHTHTHTDYILQGTSVTERAPRPEKYIPPALLRPSPLPLPSSFFIKFSRSSWEKYNKYIAVTARLIDDAATAADKKDSLPSAHAKKSSSRASERPVAVWYSAGGQQYKGVIKRWQWGYACCEYTGAPIVEGLRAELSRCINISRALMKSLLSVTNGLSLIWRLGC